MRLKVGGRWFVALLTLSLAGLVGPAVHGAAPGRPLIEAVKKGDTTTVRMLLGKGIDVNATEADGSTALHWAAQRDDIDAVDRLIGAGAHARAANRYGITPLWLASVNGNAAIADRLLKAGADPNARRLDTGETPLMIAARSGHTSVLALLLAHGGNVNVVESVRNQTALMWAAAQNHPEVVRLLLETGADVTARSKTQLTPLIFAIRAGDVESTRLLLDAGADVKARAADGTTMLVLAILNVRFKVASLLLERGADPNGDDPHARPLHVLTLVRRADNRALSTVIPRLAPQTEMDSLDFASELLKRGADVNWSDPDGLRLYNQGPGGTGANVAIGMPGFNLVGATAFLLAAANCDAPFMKVLAAHGANPLLSTRQNVTPLMAAAGIGHTSGERPGTGEEALAAVKLAYELGNDPKAVIDFGKDTQQRRGAYGGARGFNGQTALHGAIVREAPALVRWLIEHGAPVGHKAADGSTALDLTRIWYSGVTSAIQQEMGKLIREKMVEQGIPVPPDPGPAVAPVPAAAAAGR